MTLVKVDIKNVASETHPDDKVVFRSDTIREAPDGGLVSTADEVVSLADGVGELELVPGPVIVTFQCRGVADTRPKRGTVPDAGPVDIAEVIEGGLTFTPPVVNRALEMIQSERDHLLDDMATTVSEAVEGELGATVRDAQTAATTAVQAATLADGRATSAESKVDSYTPRVVALEAMAGLSPESPVDGQTANLLTQPDTLTRAALGGLTTLRVTTAAQETSTMGADIMTPTGWVMGQGWSGSLAVGFTHTPGSTEPLTWTPPENTGTTTWLVEWTYAGPPGVHQYVYSGYDVHLGGGYAGITYQGAGASNVNFSRAIKSQANGPLVFTPWTEFEGTIANITVRPVESAAAVGVGWNDADGYRTAELRFSKSIFDSVYLGKDAGKFNYSGVSNVAIGSYAMANNITGFFNTAVGRNALMSNISGTRNVALGHNALQLNTSGDRNVGIGPFALTRNTTGQRNVAIGVDVLWRLEDGSDNIGVGYLALTELKNSSRNIAIGRYAMRHTHGATTGVTTDNIAIGYEALGRVLGSGHIAIGRRAMATQSSGTANVAIGDYALEVSNADQQVAVGEEALRHFTGGRNTALGHNAARGVAGQSTGTRNVAVGDNAAVGLTAGSNNTIIGPSAGASLTTGSNNILIGFAADSRAANGQPANAENFLNIGNFLYGNLEAKRFGINRLIPTARFHVGAGTSEPGGAPIKVDPGPLLSTPEVGALEFSAGKLYFTPSTGSRREIAFV